MTRTSSIMGLVLVGALSLTACGSGKDDDAASASASSTSAAVASTSASTEPSGAAGAADASEATKGKDADGRSAGSGKQANSKASRDDVAEITALANGLVGDMPVADFFQYNMDHFCSSYINNKVDRENFQTEIDRMRSENKMLSEVATVVTVTDVTDIKVSGDNATATVVGTLDGHERSDPAEFLRENGTWTICPAS